MSGVTDAAREAGNRASNELESTMGEAPGGKSGQGFAAGFGGKLKAGIAGAALAAGALLAQGIGDALEHGAIKSRLQAQLGTTNEAAASAGKLAGKLYSKGVTEDFQTAADTIKAVMQSGIAPPGATNDQLQAISTKVADVAGVFDQDLGGVTNAVSQMLRTGLAPNAEAALDVLTKGFQNGTNKADDLVDTFNEYGVQFQKLGLDGPAALGLISQAVQAGARDSDVAADALKEFSIRAIDGSKTTADGFKALGLDAEDMAAKIGQGGKTASDGLSLTLQKLKEIPDPVARSQAAVALFGTQSEDLGAALYAMDPSNAVAALGEVGGAAEKMGNTLRDNAQSKIEVFKRSISEGVTNAVGGYLIPWVERGASVVGSVLGPAFTKGREVATELFSGIGSGSGIVSEVGGKLSSLADTAKVYVLPAVQGLGDVVVGKLLPAYQSVASAVGSGFLPLFRTVGSILTDTVFPAVMRVYGAVYENLTPIVSAAADVIRQYVAPGVQMLGEKLTEVYVKAQPVISVVVTVTEAVAKFAARLLGEVIPPVLRFAGEVLGSLFNALGTAISWVGNVIDWVVRFGRGIADAAGAVGRFAGSVSDHFNSFKSAVSNGCSEAVSYVTGLPGRFVSGLSSLGSYLARAGRDGFNDMKGAVTDGAGKVVEEAKALPGKVATGIGNLGTLLVGEGRHVVEGLWQGIQNAGGWIKDKVSGFVSNVIPGPIRDALGIHSPSRVTAELGMWAGRGLAVGLEATAPEMRRTAEGYALGLADALTTGPRAVPALAVGTAPALARDAITPTEGASVRSNAAGAGVTVNVRTDADPYEIGRAIAWDTRYGGR
ncbi:phage tail tape measure protein [Kitasatospora sp. NPDC088346]|uniref:phage tail tape measure protein n=1 Tax=Kitasatospora sp. NPDC088346 TaxID=3364073 RepID=UPI00382EC076